MEARSRSRRASSAIRRIRSSLAPNSIRASASQNWVRTALFSGNDRPFTVASRSFNRSASRSLISPAAFSVKVSATIRVTGKPDRSGPPANNRKRSRSVNRVVFPVPAPASTTMLASNTFRAMSREFWSAVRFMGGGTPTTERGPEGRPPARPSGGWGRGLFGRRGRNRNTRNGRRALPWDE